MATTLLKSNDMLFPESLRAISQPPKQLYVVCANWENILSRPKVAIVGSRKVTPYGTTVTKQVATELALAGVVVISGLAYGVDAIAHQATLEAGGVTVAILPTSLDAIYPVRHTQLAHTIVEQGGALITEYEAGATPFKWNFVERNRIVSGFADALVVTEAAAKSGTLHTADFALDQGREVFAVPGNITSPASEGTNSLIKAGAQPLTSAQDILTYLGITGRKRAIPTSSDPVEQAILNGLLDGITDASALQTCSDTSIQHFNQALTMLEIKGIIENTGNNQWNLC
jgi:DNA processing protein